MGQEKRGRTNKIFLKKPIADRHAVRYS